MSREWVTGGRALCELGIRTLRQEVEEFPELGREPSVIEAHTAMVLALAALDALGSRPGPSELEEARAAVRRAQEAVARARAAIASRRGGGETPGPYRRA